MNSQKGIGIVTGIETVIGIATGTETEKENVIVIRTEIETGTGEETGIVTEIATEIGIVIATVTEIEIATENVAPDGVIVIEIVRKSGIEIGIVTVIENVTEIATGEMASKTDKFLIHGLISNLNRETSKTNQVFSTDYEVWPMMDMQAWTERTVGEYSLILIHCYDKSFSKILVTIFHSLSNFLCK